jgi:hypothetical protein
MIARHEPDRGSCLLAGARIAANPPRVNMDGFAELRQESRASMCITADATRVNNNHRSRGLFTPSPPRFNTCV